MNRLKTLFLCLILGVGIAHPQVVSDTDGAASNVSRGPGIKDYTDLYFYDGSNRVEYVCTAASSRARTTWTTSGSTLTSIVVSSNVATVTFAAAHGLAVNNPLTVAGGSVAVFQNVTYAVASVPTSTTLTFAVTTPNATHNNAGLQVSSTAPRSTDAIWKITKYRYNGSGLIVSKQTSDWKQICDNATSLTYR